MSEPISRRSPVDLDDRRAGIEVVDGVQLVVAKDPRPGARAVERVAAAVAEDRGGIQTRHATAATELRYAHAEVVAAGPLGRDLAPGAQRVAIVVGSAGDEQVFLVAAVESAGDAAGHQEVAPALAAG